MCVWGGGNVRLQAALGTVSVDKNYIVYISKGQKKMESFQNEEIANV